MTGIFSFGWSVPQIGYGMQMGWGGGGGSFASSGSYFFGGTSTGFSPPQGPAGFYYGWSSGGSGGGFSRMYGAMGPFAWVQGGGGPVSSGMRGVGDMVGSWDFDPGDPRQVEAYMNSHIPSSSAGGADDAAVERHKSAPRSAAGRAKDYYDAAVDDNSFSKVHPDYYKDLTTTPKGETKEAKTERKDEYERENFLYRFAEYLYNHTKGQARQDYRAQFMRRHEKMKAAGEISSEKRLISLLDPAADSHSDVSVSDIPPFPKGYSSSSMPADKVYSKLRFALENQFGGEWRSVVGSLYDKQLDRIQGMGESAYADKPIDRPEIVEKLRNENNFTEAESKAIVASAFDGVTSAYDADEIYNKIQHIRSTQGADIDDERLGKFTTWYVKKVKKVTDDEGLQKAWKSVNEAQKKKKKGATFTAVDAMDAIDKALGGKGNSDKPANKKAEKPQKKAKVKKSGGSGDKTGLNKLGDE